jgi:putative ABC transport system permease protein
MGFNKAQHFLSNDPEETGYWSVIMLGSYDIAKTMGLELVEGVGFSANKNHPVNQILVNETFVDNLNLQNPVSKSIYGSSWGGARDSKVYEIVGIVKDFHYQSLRSPIDNLVIYPIEGLDELRTFALIRLRKGLIPETLPFIEEQWNEYSNHFPFRYSMLKNDLHGLYQKEKQTMKLFKIFSLLAILIACLGLYGLSVFIVNRREKEMGIRKSLGAPMIKILLNLVRQFIGWIFIAAVIAMPIAYFLIKMWLHEFAFQIKPNSFDFMMSFLVVLLILTSVVIIQVSKIARVNPAKALKDE